ncbi:MAG: hypothetical protein AVDCRST_MAG15-2230, partial [uncultured Rubellimicrobium sp.]
GRPGCGSPCGRCAALPPGHLEADHLLLQSNPSRPARLCLRPYTSCRPPTISRSGIRRPLILGSLAGPRSCFREVRRL